MARGLKRLGVSLEEYGDGIDVTGGRVHGGTVDGAGDHRCAMSFAILGQVAEGELMIEGSENIDTSFPSFVSDLVSVGGAVNDE
jgi:3-phosphoshikimate 1-carboxyvinyltransferase